MNTVESENDRHTEQLAAKVSRLKHIALDIDNETKEHNRFLETMSFDMNTARSFLGGSARHLVNTMTSGANDRRVMYYVIGGIVFSFVFLYYVVSSLHFNMKLFIHNILKSLPLKIQVNRIEKISMNYNREFLLRILQRIDYDRLKGAVKDLQLDEVLPDKIETNDESLRKLHRILFEYEIHEGQLICPVTNRKYPISKGIANML